MMTRRTTIVMIVILIATTMITRRMKAMETLVGVDLNADFAARGPSG